MKRLTLFIVLLIVASFAAFAVSLGWTYTTAANYTYDSSKIEFSSGQAQLRTDFFDASWQYRRAITIDNSTNTNTLNEYQIELNITSADTNFWAKVNADGSDVRFADSDKTTLIDFYEESFNNTTDTARYWVKVPTIEASSSKTIYLYYGNSATTSASNIETTFSYSEPRTVAYVVNQLIADNGLTVLSLADGNQITDGSATLNIDDQVSGFFASSGLTQGAAIRAKKVFQGDLDRVGTDIISPISWAGTSFSYYHYRGTPVLNIVSPFGVANVKFYDVDSETKSFTVDGNGTTESISVALHHAFHVTSDLPILVQIHGTYYDSRPLYPATTENLYGVPSTLGPVGGVANNSFNWYGSDGSSGALTLNHNGVSNVNGVGGAGSCVAKLVQGSSPIGVAQTADAAGSEASTFLPFRELGTVYGAQQVVNYIAIAAPKPNTTCTLYNSLGTAIATKESGSRTDVNKILFNSTDFGTTTLAAGWKIVADKPIFAYYDKSSGAKETNLMSYKQMRQYTYPTPTAQISTTDDLRYSNSNPTIEVKAASALNFTNLNSFSETATKNGGEIRYILSTDAGSSWFYWNNSSWAVTDQTFSQANTAEVINANISSLVSGTNQLVVRAYLNSDGNQLVRLDSLTINAAPVGGISQDYVITAAFCSQETDASGNVNFSFRLKTPNSTACTLQSFQYSTNEGASWLTPTNADLTTALSSGWTNNAGSNYSSAFGFSGTLYTLTWETTNSDISGLVGQDIETVAIRFLVFDGTDTSESYVSSEAFEIDNLNPASLEIISLTTQPTAGSSVANLFVAFSENNPASNNFFIAINGGSYGPATTGESGVANPATQETNVGAVLDGNDYVSQIKAVAVDQFGNSLTSEVTLSTANRYVKPYLPLAPTILSPEATTVSLMINPHPSETTGLEYAIYETTQSKYVQSNGSLGSSAYWATLATWGTTVEVVGLSAPTYAYTFKVKSRNTSDSQNLASSQSDWSATGNASTSRPFGGFTQNNIVPANVVTQETDGSGLITLSFRVKDIDLNSCTLKTPQYLTSRGGQWQTLTEEALSVGWANNSGSYYSSATDWTGQIYSLTLNTKHQALTALNSSYLDFLQFRFSVSDGTYDSESPVVVSTLGLDNKVPSLATTVEIVSQPSAGDASVLLDVAFTEDNPKTNLFYVAVNGGSYEAFVSGEADKADPTTQAVPLSAALDGNDYISAAKAVHLDQFGNILTNEVTSLAQAKKYVKPYTPALLTVFDLGSSSLKIIINKHISEVDNVEYLVYELSQEKIVQADGTLGTFEVWATASAWGTIEVVGLTPPISNYSFKVKSRNPSDPNDQDSSESSWSVAAGGTIATVTPEVVSYSPTNEAVAVTPEATITLAFNRNMDLSSVENAFALQAIIDNQSNTLESVVLGSFSWTNNQTVVFTPTSSLSRGYSYRLTLSASAEDYGGFALASALSATFRVMQDSSTYNVFESSDSRAKVALGLNAIAQNGYIDINRDPINNATEIDANIILTANNKAIAEGNPFHYPLTATITEFNAYDSDSQRVTSNFAAPVTITLYYDDLDQDGYVDSTNPPIKEDDLLIYRLDEVNQLWVRVPGSTVNSALNSVTASVLHFSVYTLMSTASLNLTNAYAFPVPYKPAAGHTQITFTNLASECTIRVISMDGSLVATLAETNGDGQYSWDVTNSAGLPVASGVYLYQIKSAGDVKIGKLMVIR